MGSKLVTDPDVKNTNGERYQGGDVISCLFGVVFGIMSINQAAPNMKTIVEGKASGKQAYETIDRVPTIAIDDKSKKIVKSENV